MGTKGSTKDKRHYVPAALIGRFSLSPARIWRERRVAVYRFRNRQYSVEAADNVASARKLYRGDLDGSGRYDNDHVFDHGEREGGKAMDLIEELLVAQAGADALTMDTELWWRAATHVATQVVRAPEAEEMVTETGGYTLHLRQVHAAALAANWQFLIAPIGQEFILNDRGATGVRLADGSTGYLLPVRRHLAILVTNAPAATTPRYGGRGWQVSVPLVMLDEATVMYWNALTWAGGADEVFASRAEVLMAVQAVRGGLDAASTLPRDVLVGGQLLARATRSPHVDLDAAMFHPNGLRG